MASTSKPKWLTTKGPNQHQLIMGKFWVIRTKPVKAVVVGVCVRDVSVSLSWALRSQFAGRSGEFLTDYCIQCNVVIATISWCDPKQFTHHTGHQGSSNFEMKIIRTFERRFDRCLF